MKGTSTLLQRTCVLASSKCLVYLHCAIIAATVITAVATAVRYNADVITGNHFTTICTCYCHVYRQLAAV
jgi:hypothetical protein